MTPRRSLRTVVYLSLALVACDPSGQSPTSVDDDPLPGPATSLVVDDLLTCDFKTARAYGRDYFDQPERRTVAEILREMEDAYEAGDLALARELGFDLLAVVEGVSEAGTAAGTPADGSNFTNSVLACMDVGHEAVVDFASALALSGAFGVRGGDGDPAYAPVLSRSSNPLWGAEPADDMATWAAALGPRRLIHASLLSSPGFTDEVPVSSAYDWGTVPTAAFAPLAGDLAIGACLQDPDPRLRVQRAATILPFDALSFCVDAALSGSAGAGFLERFTGTVAAVLGPRPLRASSSLVGGIGGRAGSFSPFVVVNAGAVNLAFTVQPIDALVDEPIHVQVTARGNGGTPLPEVTIRLDIAENNASFGELSGTTSVTTGSDGVADFEVSLNKPGGFRLTAAGNLLGFDTSIVTSELFHIKQ